MAGGGFDDWQYMDESLNALGFDRMPEIEKEQCEILLQSRLLQKIIK